MLLLIAAITGSLLSVRHITVLVLVAIPVLSQLAQTALDEARQVTDQELRRGTVHTFIGIALVVSLLVFSLARVRQISVWQSRSVTASFPEGAAAFLTKGDDGGRLLNPYDWGGYLVWKLYPKQLIFIDGRADVYGDEFIDESIAAYYLRGDWDTSLEKWRITSALLPLQAPLTQGLRARGWIQIYGDSQAVILRRPGMSE
jgi:hypothetical protein